MHNNQSFLKQKERDKPFDQYFSWLIKCQTASLLSPKNCPVIKSKHTLWGSPLRDLQKIGWGCMSYDVFQKETINMCFSHKNKKQKTKKSQKEERMSWALHSSHDSKPFCIARYKAYILLHFKTKVACLYIPKLMFI